MKTAPHTVESLNAVQADWMALQSNDPQEKIDRVLAAMANQPRRHITIPADAPHLANVYWCGPVWSESRTLAEAVIRARDLGIQVDFAWRTDGQWVAIPAYLKAATLVA